MKTTVTFDLPEEVTLSEHDLAMIVAGKLFSERLISAGKAAEMAHVSKREFLETIGKYGYSFLNLTAQEVNQDLTNVINQKLKQNGLRISEAVEKEVAKLANEL